MIYRFKRICFFYAFSNIFFIGIICSLNLESVN